jgi:HAD superfamily hydrolase (TIGR01509 family)
LIQAVIFDIDGTLVDSVDYHAKSWQETFRRFGREIPFDEVRHQIGKGGDQLMPVFFSKQELDDFGKKMEETRGEIFKGQYLPHVRAFPQVRALFQRIRADGKRIVLASSAKQDEIEAYKKLADIVDLVEGATSKDDVERSKPHPDIFQGALGKLEGVDPGEAIVVGDTPYDAEAAAKAGLRTIGVLCGGFPEDELRASGCVALYRDPADLLARYDDSPLGQ